MRKETNRSTLGDQHTDRGDVSALPLLGNDQTGGPGKPRFLRREGEQRDWKGKRERKRDVERAERKREEGDPAEVKQQ